MKEKYDGWGIKKNGKLIPVFFDKRLNGKKPAEKWINQISTHSGRLIDKYEVVKIRLMEVSDE